VTTAPSERDLAAYVAAARRLMDHGGYERSGDPAQARRWGIDHIRAWLDAHGSPDARPTVHVAGSKGKGSVAIMVEAVLRAHGAHTLLLTSPDLHQKRERIAIDGTPIGYAEFAAVADRLFADETTATWSLFEAVTVMGWLAGAGAGCDWQVLEVGLGGRLDTTNAVREKAVVVITPIDLEHTAILGETIPQIAGEKAGIITGPCDVVVSPLRASALDVVRVRAAEAGARLHEVTTLCALRRDAPRLDGQELSLRTPLRTYRKLKLPLVGAHQGENATAAVLAAELAVASQGGELAEAAVREGLAGVRCPGRFEVARERPLTILDGAHTLLAARRLRQALDEVGVPRRRVIVLGLLAGKDIDGVVGELIGDEDEVIVAAPHSERAADPGEVLRAVQRTGAIVQRVAGIAEALERAAALAGERGAIVVAGSLYTVAEAREALLGITGDRAFGLR
jgi:dihydrofolate synthase/folylpolyglutamate synthase